MNIAAAAFTFGQRDRRALLLLCLAALSILVLRVTVFSDSQAKVVKAADSIPLAQKRLARLRQIAATVPGKEAVLKQVTADLAARESGIMRADTAPQAQAQLLQIVRRVGKTEGIDVRGGEFGSVRPLGND